MIDRTTTLYCIVDDLLKAIGHEDDCRCVLSDSEVITAALVAAFNFGGNIERSRSFLQEAGLMPRMLSRSRLNRRLHRVADLVHTLFHQLGAALKQLGPSTKYLLDSFPVAICDNMRISRCRLVKDEEFRGYIASKRRYYRVEALNLSEGNRAEETTQAIHGC